MEEQNLSSPLANALRFAKASADLGKRVLLPVNSTAVHARDRSSMYDSSLSLGSCCDSGLHEHAGGHKAEGLDAETNIDIVSAFCLVASWSVAVASYSRIVCELLTQHNGYLCKVRPLWSPSLLSSCCSRYPPSTAAAASTQLCYIQLALSQCFWPYVAMLLPLHPWPPCSLPS
jgi:hypothetical protein